MRYYLLPPQKPAATRLFNGGNMQTAVSANQIRQHTGTPEMNKQTKAAVKLQDRKWWARQLGRIREAFQTWTTQTQQPKGFDLCITLRDNGVTCHGYVVHDSMVKICQTQCPSRCHRHCTSNGYNWLVDDAVSVPSIHLYIIHNVQLLPIQQCYKNVVTVSMTSMMAEFIMGFQHIAFLPSQASFPITFLKNYARGESVKTTTCHKTVVGVKQISMIPA